MPGCPYESEEGLHKGDEFYKIDGKRIFMQMDVGDFLDQGSGVYDLVMLRDGEKVTLKDFPMERILYEGQSQKMYGFYFGYEKATPLTVLKNAWNTCMEFSRWVKLGLDELIHGKVSVEEMSGPVGIVDLMAETGEAARDHRRRALQHLLSHGLHRGEPRHHEHAAPPGAGRRQGLPAAGDLGHRDRDGQKAQPQV